MFQFVPFVSLDVFFSFAHVKWPPNSPLQKIRFEVFKILPVLDPDPSVTRLGSNLFVVVANNKRTEIIFFMLWLKT